MWALGAIVYNMFTGVPPFYEEDNSILEEKIRVCQFSADLPVITEKASKNLKLFLEGTMKIDPE